MSRQISTQVIEEKKNEILNLRLLMREHKDSDGIVNRLLGYFTLNDDVQRINHISQTPEQVRANQLIIDAQLDRVEAKLRLLRPQLRNDMAQLPASVATEYIGLVTSISEFFIDVIAFISEFFVKAYDLLKKGAVIVWDGIKTVFNSVKDLIKSIFG